MTPATRNLTLDYEQDVAPPRQLTDADLELRIELVNGSSASAGKSLRFELTAPAFGHQETLFGCHPLLGDLESHFGRFYGRIADALARDAPDPLGPPCAELAELLPQDLHEQLWKVKDQGLTLWIRPEAEAWIPWEILELRIREGRRWLLGPRLCEAFRITRWPMHVACQRHLPVRRLGAMLGSFSDLPALSEEQGFLEGLREEGRTVEILAPVREEVLAAMESGSYDSWHFASHGEWFDSKPTEAELQLSFGEPLKLDDVLHEAPNFCSNHPLVVLNACHLGRGGRGLVSWSGWTAKLAQMEAGAVLGALWPIEDQAAVRFVSTFYGAFLAGMPLAEAVQRARLETREAFPEAPAWLAFVAYGHPLAVCADPERHPSKVSTSGPSPASGREVNSNSAPPPPEEIMALPPSSPGRRRTEGGGFRGMRFHRIRWALAGLVLSVLAFVVLAGIRTDTHIQLDLTVHRLAFTAGGEKRAPLTDSPLPLDSVTIARFARLEMHPLELSRLDAQGGWKPATGLEEKVALVAHAQESQASIEAPESAPGPASLTLDRWWIEPGSRVIVRAAEHGPGIDLGIEVFPSGSLLLSVHGPFALTADSVAFRGLGTEPGDRTAPQAFLMGRLRNDRSSMEISPGNESLTISGTVRPSAAEEPLLSRELPITSLDLLTQDADGEWLSTLVDEGTLSYPGRDQTLPLAAGEFLAVNGLRDFRLTRVALDPKSGALRVSLDGIAQEVRSGPKGQARDYRLSLYEKWIRGHLVQSLAAWITGWMALALMLAEVWQHLAKRE